MIYVKCFKCSLSNFKNCEHVILSIELNVIVIKESNSEHRTIYVIINDKTTWLIVGSINLMQLCSAVLLLCLGRVLLRSQIITYIHMISSLLYKLFSDVWIIYCLNKLWTIVCKLDY